MFRAVRDSFRGYPLAMARHLKIGPGTILDKVPAGLEQALRDQMSHLPIALSYEGYFAITFPMIRNLLVP